MMASLDAIKLAERLQGLKREEYWLHMEAASPLEKYPAKHHARRVRDKLDVTEGLVYLPGALARSNEDSDMPAPFRQRRYFYYMSGCNEPNCHVTYDVLHDTLALFIPRINPERVIWNGRGSTPAEALDKYDIDEVYFIDELETWIQAWVMHNRATLYILHESQAPKVPYFFGQPDSTSLQPAMNLARVVKDEHEIKLIRKANNISSEAHKQVLANILKFKNEAQVEGLFLDVCISKQAKQQAYDPIAASGPNAGTLHYDANNEDFDGRQLMCLDAGCEFELYASDITRTFPLAGSWPSSEAENIYKLVQRMQEACIEKLAPGVRYLDLHILAHQIAIDGLLRLGILHNGTREEIFKAGTSRAFFPHGLGHHVGLEVHDVGQKELMSLYEKNPKYEKAPSLYPEDFHLPVYDTELCRAPTDPQSPHLEEGMVVTVEPGIYFSAYALSYFYLPSPVHSKFINTEVVYYYFPVGGVRIEDDILITPKGHENLTTAPKGEAMLEIIRNENSKYNFVAVPSAAGPRGGFSIERKDVAGVEPLRRAPGIPKRLSEPQPKPISRAATAPVEPLSTRDIPDFEPFNGPSLFSGFQRPATKDEALPKRCSSQHVRPPPQTPPQPNLPMCGNASKEFTHIWLKWDSWASKQSAIDNQKPKPVCRDCAVLSQTMDRLRDTLKQSPKASPKLEQAATARTEPATSKQVPEMQQLNLPTRPATSNHGLVTSLPSCANLPNPFAKAPKLNLAPLPAQAPQRRSVTFDSYLQILPSKAVKPKATSSNPWSPTYVPALRNARTMTNPNSLQESIPQCQPQPTAIRSLHTAQEREREGRRHPFTRVPTSRPSMPTLRSDRFENTATATSSSNRHSVAPSNPPFFNYTPPTLDSQGNGSGFESLQKLKSDTQPGCITCRLRLLKCEGTKPECHNCQRGGYTCGTKDVSRPKRYLPKPMASGNPYLDNTTTITTSAPASAARKPDRSVHDQKLDDLKRAMDELWRVKEDVERTFGASWRDGRQDEGKKEWSERVVGDVDKVLGGAARDGRRNQ